MVKSNSKISNLLAEEIGEEHFSRNAGTPMRDDAFQLADEEKMKRIESSFKDIMETLGLDLNDDSLNGTPRRVAKMFVKEIFSGLNPENKPSVTLFENSYNYRQMLVEKGIKVQSTCEHHFLPIYGKATVAYIPKGKVVGLSKLNRIVEYYAKRPQVQERLTNQIAEELKNALGTEDVAVYIDAKHMCVQARGVEHMDCSTVTSYFGGEFLNDSTKREFFASMNQ